MAERATAANVAAAAVGDQKYHAAINILKTDIHRAKGAQSKASGEASQAYSRIEKLGVNKKAANFIAGLLTQEASIAEDVLRSVINLATAANIMPQEDLVDLADRLENSDRSMRRVAGDGGTGGDDEGDEPEDDDDADEQHADGGATDDAGEGERQHAGDTASQEEWDAAAEAAAAKQKVGDRKSPAEARAARKNALRSVPEATGARVH